MVVGDAIPCMYSHREYGPGMNTAQCWALVAGQRRELADAVAGLPGAAWDTPSLCAGWRVRDVVAHVWGAKTVSCALTCSVWTM